MNPGAWDFVTHETFCMKLDAREALDCGVEIPLRRRNIKEQQ